MSNAAFWNKIAPKYATDPIRDMDSYVQTRDRIIEVLQPHHRVLELGCGTGSTAFELAGGVDRYIGSDVASEMIQIARSKQTPDTPDHLSFVVQDAVGAPYAGHDVVIALNLLHLVPDMEQVLAQIFGALPSGGLLISKTALLSDGPWYVRAAVPVMRAVGKAPFVRNLSQTGLDAALRNAGFTVTDTLVQTGLVPRMFVVARKP